MRRSVCNARRHGCRRWLPAQLFVGTSLSEEFYGIQTNPNDFVRKTCVQFIIGDRDVENGWDAYLEELKKFGSERYLEIYKETYATVIGK